MLHTNRIHDDCITMLLARSATNTINTNQSQLKKQCTYNLYKLHMQAATRLKLNSMEGEGKNEC